ncbi:hypothetical protein Cflav_PD2807 [Pedosphaera parvula Ellin514]|uniref:Uncharacterized protein n=1 Tax=Pedosphaera parvula (strain Ellin514) TaxID=320771 RepID=B9XJX7_PEDPL|nr:hypothetical protein Cflav_PD2807 [Pedosphaera parvula Ellin514]
MLRLNLNGAIPSDGRTLRKGMIVGIKNPVKLTNMAGERRPSALLARLEEGR